MGTPDLGLLLVLGRQQLGLFQGHRATMPMRPQECMVIKDLLKNDHVTREVRPLQRKFSRCPVDLSALDCFGNQGHSLSATGTFGIEVLASSEAPCYPGNKQIEKLERLPEEDA